MDIIIEEVGNDKLSIIHNMFKKWNNKLEYIYTNKKGTYLIISVFFVICE